MKHKAFTLVELLVSISIIAILAGLVMGSLHYAMERAKEQKTRSTIKRLNGLVMDRIERYETWRVSLVLVPPPPELTEEERIEWTLANRRKKLNAIRDLMRMEMPDRLSDITTGPISGIPQPRIHWKYQRWLDAVEPTPQCIGAEIFYAMIVLGDPEARERLRDNEIADTDGDGALEFVDGWGRPICWLRWPVGFSSQSDLQGDWPLMFHDPLDPYRVHEGAFLTFPLVYSAGRDGVYDIDVQPDFNCAATPLINPYAQQVGQPVDDESPGYYDNIHNHRW